MIFIILSICLVIFALWLVYKSDPDIKITILSSKLLDTIYTKSQVAFILALIFPVSFLQYLKLKLTMKKFIKYLVISLVVIFAVTTVISVGEKFVTFYNTEKQMATTYNEEVSNRVALLDKIAAKISGNAEITLKADSSFKEVIYTVMTNRKDGENLAWKWLQESNPTASFSQIAIMYERLSNVVNESREEFYAQEKLLSKINQQHEAFLTTFPNNVYNYVLNEPRFTYKPITSTATQKAAASGTNNDVKVFK